MAVRNRSDLMNMVRNLIGERTDDEALSIVEDFNDSLQEPSEDWKSKYEENDAQWRRKYRERFFEGDSGAAQMESEMDDPAPGQETEVIATYDQLFGGDE